MKPLHFKLKSGLVLTVVPETQVTMDGHPILSLNYNLFKNEAGVYSHGVSTNAHNNSLKKKDPGYLGFITFEQPGKMYTYTSESDKPLSRTEVEETIELITQIRDNPALWKTD